MAKKEPLYPHVPKSLKVAALSAATERIATERTITPEEEQAIRAAQDVIRQLEQMRSQLGKLYDKVKYSMTEWAGPRQKAADFVNSADNLQMELTEKIRALRSRR